MPNMDYPGPCLSCISECGLWDDDSNRESAQSGDQSGNQSGSREEPNS